MAEFEQGLTYYSFGSRYLREKVPYLRGTDVKVLQRMLNKLPERFRGPELVEDGIYGGRTGEAVQRMQEAFRLRVDGIVGPQTFYALGKETGSYIEEGPEVGLRDLKMGMEGGDVRVVQNRLNSLGRTYARITGGPADGVFGRRTRRLVRRFQGDIQGQDRGVPMDGQVKCETFDALYIFSNMGGRTLRQCSEGYDVYWLQCFLKQCNYYQGELDGIFGPLTEQAVQEFQEAKAIEVDGIVGPETFFMVGMSMP